MKALLATVFALVGCAATAPDGSVVEIASGQSASGIATDGANVYWTNRATGEIMRCAAEGCDAPTAIATGATEPAGISVSGSDVFWTDRGSVSRARTNGGDVTRVAPASDAWGVAASADRVFWTTNATAGWVMTCKVTGCAGGAAHLAGGESSFAIATDATNVYWSDWNAIWTCPLDGCDGVPTPIALVAGHVAIAVDDANVYWAYPNAGLVLACEKHGCGVPRVLAAGQNGAASIASDGTNVVWTTATSVASCHVSGCGGKPTLLATLDAPGRAIALDATNVYFASGDRVMRVAKTF